ncbi:MAG: peptidyl-prolyl cis-trans isomerase [Candidatus Omnitrophota bacterium]|nr:peptidyl-prolyl cis-trans isomerase [Candidatus Omnitrophota bacterium]
MVQINLRYLLAILVFFVLSQGCDNVSFLKKREVKKEPLLSQPISRGPIVARINNLALTLDDLNTEIEMHNAMLPPELKINGRQEKLGYLKNEMIKKVILYQEALRRELEYDIEVRQVLARQKRDLLVVQLVRKEAERVDVTQSEIDEYYSSNRENLREPQERWIREIVVPTEAEAKDILMKLLQGEDFGSIAKQYSRSASLVQEGDLGFVKPGQRFSNFDEVAFADSLDVGNTSSIFKGPEGYYIIRLEGKRGGQIQHVSLVANDIKRLLTLIKQKKLIDDLVDRLFKSSQMEFYDNEVR